MCSLGIVHVRDILHGSLKLTSTGGEKGEGKPPHKVTIMETMEKQLTSSSS